MHNQLVIALAVASISVAACGGNERHANPPESRGNGISGVDGVAGMGDPGGAEAVNGGTTITSGSPASPMEGACKSVAAPLTLKTRDACIKGCRGYDSTVPQGSSCVSQKDSCVFQCYEKFGSN